MSNLPTLTGLKSAPEFQEADSDTQLKYYDAWADAQRESANAQGLVGDAISQVEGYLGEQRSELEYEHRLEKYQKPGFFQSISNAIVRGTANTTADVQGVLAGESSKEADRLNDDKSERIAPLIETLQNDETYQAKVKDSQLRMAEELLRPQAESNEKVREVLSGIEKQRQELNRTPKQRTNETLFALDSLDEITAEFDSAIDQQFESADNLADSSIESRRTAAMFGSSEGRRQFDESEGIGEALQVLVDNPAVALEIAAESTPSVVAPVAAGAVGTIVSGGNPGFGALSAAGAGFGVEVAASYNQFLAEEAGFENGFETGEDLLAALRNPEAVRRAKARAVNRGIPIAAVDALSLGIGSALTKVATKTAANATATTATKTALKQGAIKGGATVARGSIDAAAGAGGEVAAQVASGQEVDMKEALAEAIGQVVTGVGMDASQTGGAIGRFANDVSPDVAGVDSVANESFQDVTFQPTQESVSQPPVDQSETVSLPDADDGSGIIRPIADDFSTIEDDTDIVIEEPEVATPESRPQPLKEVLAEINEVDPRPTPQVEETVASEPVQEESESTALDDDDWVPFPEPGVEASQQTDPDPSNPFASDNMVSNRDRLTGLQQEQLDTLISLDDAGKTAFLEENRVPDSVLEAVLDESGDSEAIYTELDRRAMAEDASQLDAFSDQTTETLDEAIGAIGGLQTPRQARESGDPLALEFEQIQKESSTRIGRFKKTGQPFDRAIILLRERGFDFETPGDLANALIDHDRGSTVRSNPGLTQTTNSENLFSPRDNGPNPDRARLQRLTDFLKRELGSDPRVDPSAIGRIAATQFGESVKPEGRGQEFAAAQEVANLFGRRIVVVENLPLNGLVNRKDSEHVFIAEDSTRSPFVVANHEMLHQMRVNEPGLYAELDAAVEADVDAWIASERPGLVNESSGLQKEELLADYLAEMSGSIGFWDKLADNTPSLFKKLADYIRDFFAKVHINALVNDVQVTPFLKDAARARHAMEEALTKFAAKQRLKGLGIQSIEEGQTDTDADSPNRFMPRAIKDATQVFGEMTGQADEIQGHEEREQAVRSRVFNGREEVSEQQTEQAYRVLNEIQSGTLDATAMLGLDGANQQLKNELYAYGRKLAKAGDTDLLKAIETYGNQFFNREATVAGRVLNAIGHEVASMQGQLQIKENDKNETLDNIRPGPEPGTNRKFSELINELESQLGQERLENLSEEEISAIAAAIVAELDGGTKKPKRRRRAKTQREIRRDFFSDENKHFGDEITDMLDSMFESDNVFSDLRQASPIEKKAAADVIVTNQINTGRRSKEEFRKALEALGLSGDNAEAIFDRISEGREAENLEATKKRKKRRERTPAELLAAEADREATRVDRLNERVRKLNDRIQNPKEGTPRKPDELRKLVNGQLGKTPLDESGFMDALRALGVRKEEATSLFETLQEERAKRAEIEQLKKEAKAAAEKTLEQEQAERILKALAASQSDTQSNAPRKPPVNKVRELYKTLLDFGPVMSEARFKQDLGALGVDANTSGTLYQLAMKERANRESVNRNRSANRAVEKSIPFLIRELLANPLLQMVGPSERKRIATRLFMESGGLSRPDAVSAANAFDSQFIGKLSQARMELAERWMKQRNPAMKFDKPMNRRQAPTLSDRVRRAVRSGVMDPRLRLSEELAKENGWADFTVKEVEQLAVLDEKLADENLTNMEETRYKGQMFDIVRKSNLGPGVKEAASSFYLANIFSGIKTHLLATSSLSRFSLRAFAIDPVVAVIGNKTASSEARIEAWGEAIGSLLDHLENGAKSALFTARTGELRGLIEKESILGIDSLKQLHEVAMRTLRNPNASGFAKSKAAMKLVVAFSRWNFRAMSAADSAIQTLIREYDKQFLSTSRALAAGMSVPQVRALRNEVFRMTHVFESEGRAKGFDGNDLSIYVNDRISMAIFEGLEGKGVDLNEVSELAQREASMATGVKEIEGGIIGKGAKFVQQWANEAGLPGRFVAPVVRTPYNIFHDSAWLSPYGFKRILSTYKKTKGFKEWENSEYPVSLGSPRQIMLRSVEAGFGTALMGTLALLLKLNEDEEEEDQFFRINLGGPSMANSTEWTAWRQQGRRPHTIQFRFPGSDKWVSQGFRQGGLEPLNFAATMVGAWEQKEFNRAASNLEDPYQQYAVSLMQEMTGESLFFLRGFSRGPGLTEDSLGREAGFRASGLVPYSGLLKTANKFGEFKESSGDFASAFAMQLPIVPLVQGEERLNALGDRLQGTTHQASFDVGAKLGIPTGFVIGGTGDKSDVYEVLNYHKKFPSDPRRSSLGDVTMSEFTEFVKKRGDILSKAIRQDRAKILGMTSEEFGKWLSTAQSNATKEAKKALGL